MWLSKAFLLLFGKVKKQQHFLHFAILLSLRHFSGHELIFFRQFVKYVLINTDTNI